MIKIPDNAGKGSSLAVVYAREKRMMRTMAVAVSLAVIISLPLAPWRVTTGLLLGGLLSLLNFYWMRVSTTAMFDTALAVGKTPRIRMSTFILRYFVLVAVALAAYHLDFVSFAATIVGMCSFVVGFFFEAFREAYLAITHREGTS